MTERLTLVTPSFEKHFEQYSKMLESINHNCLDPNNLDIVIVIEEKNKELFSELAEKYKLFNIKLVTTEGILERVSINGSPSEFLQRIGKFTFQTLKKFGGILESNTKWSLVVDSETVFIKPFKASELLNNYVEQKYVFYTSIKARGANWNHSLGNKVNENAASALGIKSIDNWYMDIFHWFYEKDKVEDLLFSKLGKKWFDLLNKTREPIDNFECVLYYSYLNQYHSEEYKFLDLVDSLKQYVEPAISGRLKLDELPFSLHGNDFLLSLVGANDVLALSKFFEHFKLSLIRLEPSYIDVNYLSNLKKLPYCTAIVSAQYLMWMNKKIAVCLSGKFMHDEFLGYPYEQLNYEHKVRSILGFLSGVNCDLYIHSWKHPCETYIIDNLKPKKYLFEEQINFKNLADKIKNTENSYCKLGRDAGTLSMFYSMQQAYSLIDDVTEYDYIIRLRPDIYSEFSLKEILFTISDNGDFLPDAVYIPSNFQSKGMNDQFAIGRTSMMEKYFSMYSFIEKHISTLFFNPEYMLAKKLIEDDVKVVLLDMPYALHRGQLIRPWKTLQLLHEQESTWWSKTTHIARLQDVTPYFEKRYRSAELLNSLPLNIRLLGKLKDNNKYILVETNDYDPCVHVRACVKLFGILLPWKMRFVDGVVSYSKSDYSIYYNIDIVDNSLYVYQTISDFRSIKSGIIKCDSFELLYGSDVRLLQFNFIIKCKHIFENKYNAIKFRCKNIFGDKYRNLKIKLRSILGESKYNKLKRVFLKTKNRLFY